VGKSIAMRIFAAALLAVPLLAHAVGLGNLRVLSALGQPLDAEIQIVSEQAGEMDSVTARLPSQDAFRQAGIEFNPVLLGMQFKVEQHDGKPVLKLTTKQPVNEPFLDILVELQWSSGRLVREYTFLLDPPEYKVPKAVVTPAPSVMPTEKPAQAAAAAAPIEAKPLEAKPLETKPLEAAPPPPPPFIPQPKAPVTHEVKKGDTLGAIARANMPRGVTYNQMLIALYRANRAAFIRDNINLVRAGRILDIPDEEAVSAIDPDDATRLVRSQMADFAAYRRKLAAAAPATSAAAPERAVSGRIGAKPEETAPAAQKDQLKLSKADAGNASGAMSSAASADDQAARERALQEAQSRVAELEKNVSDLQKLVELKNKALAELQQKATAAPAAPAPVPAAAPAPKPAAEPAKAAEAPKPAAEPAKPAAAPAPKPAAPQPAAPKPAPKPRPMAKTPPPPPSFLDEVLDDPLKLGGVGVALVLILGGGAWAWRRRKKAGQALGEGSFSALSQAGGAASEFSAGPSIGAGPSLSQSSVGGMEADEVDPIAEADVYMAYGRDAQAEEILNEALQKDAKRPAIHAKLMEIYAGRRDARSFEQAAHKLQSLTGGSGPDWEKAAALGRSIDPQNPLYGGTGEAAAAGPSFGAEPEPVHAPAPNLDFDLDAASAPAAGPDIPLDAGEQEHTQPTASAAFDFDIGGSTGEMQASDFARGGTLRMDRGAQAKSEAAGLEFDLGGGGETQKAAETGAIEFEAPAAAPEPAPKAEPAATAADTLGSMDFNLDLDMGETKPTPTPSAEPAPLDLSSISLDLDTPGEAASPAASSDPKWQEVATKLDLAKAYEEMGDKDGARELLNEVVKEGDSAQQGQAKQMLSSLG
jgi:pilus assembly protein FimV